MNQYNNLYSFIFRKVSLILHHLIKLGIISVELLTNTSLQNKELVLILQFL